MFPDFADFINHSSPFFFGLASAFTPCTLAIFPLLLYRFGFGTTRKEQQKNAIGLLVVAISFVLTFAAAGLVLQYLILSSVANIFRLLLGVVFVIGGVLQISGRLNLVNTQKHTHPLLIGLTLPWILSFSPCVLAFTANLVVSSANSTSINGGAIWQFTLFAVGILLPPAALALLGNAALPLMRRFSGGLAWIEKVAAAALILAGVFLISQITQITSFEVAIAAVISSLALVYLIYRTTLLKGKPGQQGALPLKLFGAVLVLMLAAALWVLAYSVTLPFDYLAVEAEKLIYLCTPESHNAAPAAAPLSAILTFIGLIIGGWYLVATSNWKVNLERPLNDK